MVIAALVTFGLLLAAWMAAPGQTHRASMPTEITPIEAPTPA